MKLLDLFKRNKVTLTDMKRVFSGAISSGQSSDIVNGIGVSTSCGQERNEFEWR